MTPTEMSDPVYHDEEAARLHLEALRWPSGQPVCPLCGVTDQARTLNGDSMGPGWFYCSACQSKFTVRTGTVWERSHIPLHKWLLASRMMASSKKGVSAHQIGRTLNITYKSAWFLCHRIRESMRDTDPTPLGGVGKTIEADETFYGQPGTIIHPDKGPRKGGTHGMQRVLTLVERGGKAKSLVADKLTAKDVQKFMAANASSASELNTDESPLYTTLGKRFVDHQTVNHSRGEYGRGSVTSNTVEGYFSIFKRGMVGVYQHCGEQHLHRYVTEFDFRYSNRAKLGVDDAERTTRTLKGAVGKRLTYRRASVRPAA
jgi:transposase-like protein